MSSFAHSGGQGLEDLFGFGQTGSVSHSRVRVAGLDLGTSYVKAVCVDLEPGSDDPARVVSSRRAPTPSQASSLVETALGLLAEVVAEAGPVAAVGVASMAETGVPLDEHRRPLLPLLTWDAQRPLSRTLAALDPVAHFCRTGVQLGPKAPLATWAWLRDAEPGVHARMRHWAGAADLVVHALTGRLATDHTLAGRTGAHLLDEDRWDDDVLGLVGVRPGILPEVTPADEPAGLADGVPVSVAGHDHQVGAHACGVREPGTTADSLGTSEVVLRVLTGRPDLASVHAAGMSLVRTVSDRGRALMAGASAAGAAYAAWTEQHGPAVPDHELPGGPTGLLVLPYLSGRQCPEPDPRARMRVVGDLGAVGPGVRTRALLEGLSLQTRWMRDVQRRLDPGPEAGPLVLFGGPGAQNAAWVRVKAEVLSDGIRVVREPEPVAVGAAVVGAERAGLVEPGSVVIPSDDATVREDRYAETYERFVREARGQSTRRERT